MLKGIPSILPPQLLRILAEMGHGDEIVIGDGNFPATSNGRECVHCEGHGVLEMLDAILTLFPLDDFLPDPVTLMEVVPGGITPPRPPIWDEIYATVARHEPKATIGFEERFMFYKRTREAYATVQTGEKAFYACVILRKGAISG